MSLKMLMRFHWKDFHNQINCQVTLKEGMVGKEKNSSSDQHEKSLDKSTPIIPYSQFVGFPNYSKGTRL